MKYKIDVVRIRENSITLNGWAIGKSPDSKATFRVEIGRASCRERVCLYV